MKAIVRDTYGGPEVLRLEEVQERAPAAGEVLIHVHAASVSAGDLHLLHGTPRIARLAFGLFRPKHRTPGTDVAGTVTAVGADVTHLRAGDRVFGDLSSDGFGTWAGTLTAKARNLTRIPDGIDFISAAAVPVSAVTALQGLRDKGRLANGDNVLVTGASGGVGSNAVQIAASMGANVTALTSTANTEAVIALGTHQVLDRNNGGLTGLTRQFDVILDCAGFQQYGVMQSLLNPGGRYVFVGGGGQQTSQALLRGKSMLAQPNRTDLEHIAGLLASERLRPLINRTFDLADTAAAVRHQMAGTGHGKTIISVG